MPGGVPQKRQVVDLQNARPRTQKEQDVRLRALLMEAAQHPASEPSHPDSTSSTWASACSTLLAPGSVPHSSPHWYRRSSLSIGPQALQKGTSGRGPELGLMPATEALGGTAMVGLPSPARDPTPTPSGRESWPIAGPSAPEVGLAAKEQLG